MRLLLIFPFLVSVAYGQFAFVSDKDGYVNVRSGAANTEKITDTLMNGHLVYCSETKGNWTNIQYAKKDHNDLYGYVYGDRLKQVSDYKNIPLIADQPNICTYGKDSIKVMFSEKKFERSKYRFTYYKDNKDEIQYINGKQYWGTDGEIPKTQYKSIVIKIGNRITSLPPSALDDLFEPTIYSAKVYVDTSNDIIYVQAMNSDGAGAYEVIWRIDKGVYKERFIAYGF